MVDRKRVSITPSIGDVNSRDSRFSNDSSCAKTTSFSRSNTSVCLILTSSASLSDEGTVQLCRHNSRWTRYALHRQVQPEEVGEDTKGRRSAQSEIPRFAEDLCFLVGSKRSVDCGNPEAAGTLQPTAYKRRVHQYRPCAASGNRLVACGRVVVKKMQLFSEF